MNKSTVMLMMLASVLLVGYTAEAQPQPSVARQWNEALLGAIRVDFARPTVHARNLFHTSVAIYDAWAAYDSVARPFLLGQTVRGYTCAFQGIHPPPDIDQARHETMSYAVYRLLSHRFRFSPGIATSQAQFDGLMAQLGYDAAMTSTDYGSGSPAALGNYIAQCVIDFGLQDGSNEANGYVNVFYRPANPPLVPELPGNPDIVDLNRWQPLTLEFFVDQAGNPVPEKTQTCLSPEWGRVIPFALTPDDLSIYQRDGIDYWVYHDPGPPPWIDTQTGGGLADPYKWNFALVAIWSSHFDPADGVMWDISPGAMGNLPELPQTMEDQRAFYDLLGGGDPSLGHPVNPRTGEPYLPQWVPRGDYTRVLAEFWADGPDSETPPGHWFTILNHVSDHPELRKRFKGVGAVLNDLEWDVKAYFALGGAVHDAAITAWGIKGWYDSIRPISAIRAMADRGQSTAPTLARYDPAGIPLVPGFIDLVTPGDALAGINHEHVGKIKLYAWRGPYAIEDPSIEVAGVGWVLAEHWFPYQQPTFVTPPFPGYVSGHSTYSRAAAEVLTLLTGDAYFPGGLGEYHIQKNEFLRFEEGPSVDLTLQWATYRDAADQTSLSRIWGGIHPPADDIPGRLMGARIGVNAFKLAARYFKGRS